MDYRGSGKLGYVQHSMQVHNGLIHIIHNVVHNELHVCTNQMVKDDIQYLLLSGRTKTSLVDKHTSCVQDVFVTSHLASLE